MITEKDPDSAAGPSVSGQPTPEPGFEILEDRTVIGTEAWVFKCTACGQISSRYLDPIKAGGGAWEHLRRMHGLEDRPQPLPDSATVRAQLASLTAENARLRSQLAEARERGDWLAKNVDEALAAIHAAPQEIAPLATPFAPGDLPRAVAALIERAAKIRAERDSLREERARLVAEVRKIAAEYDAEAEQAARRSTGEMSQSNDRAGMYLRGAGQVWADAASRLRALAAAPVEAPAEPGVDELVSTPAGRAWLAGVAEREASRPDPVPDSREEIEARLKAAAAPVQPEERPQFERDAAKLAQPDWCREQLAELVVEASERGLRWKNYAVVPSVIAEIDRLSAALATAEREREEVRWSHEQLRTLIERHERKLAEQLGYPERHPGIAAMVMQAGDVRREVLHLREATAWLESDAALVAAQQERDALRAEVQRIAAELRKWGGAEISAPASTKDLALDTAHRLVAALGSTPDTGSTT